MRILKSSPEIFPLLFSVLNTYSSNPHSSEHHSLNWKQTSLRAKESSQHECERLIGNRCGTGLGLIERPERKYSSFGESTSSDCFPTETTAKQTTPLLLSDKKTLEKWTQADSTQHWIFLSEVQCWLHIVIHIWPQDPLSPGFRTLRIWNQNQLLYIQLPCKIVPRKGWKGTHGSQMLAL